MKEGKRFDENLYSEAQKVYKLAVRQGFRHGTRPFSNSARIWLVMISYTDCRDIEGSVLGFTAERTD